MQNSPSTTKLVLAAQVCIVVAAISPHAFAEEQNAADTAAARALAVDGLKLAQAGRCDKAIPKLARAEKLYHSPIVLGKLGECYITQGKFVDGSEMLRKVLREPLPANPPANLMAAYERAQAALDTAKTKIASVVISTNVANEALVNVTVDGQVVPPALLGAERPIDPGDHLVEAEAPGFRKAVTRITLAAGEQQKIELVLERDPNAAAATPPAAARGPATAPTSETAAPPQAGSPLAPTEASADRQTGSSPNRTLAYVSWGVGAAALGTGAVFGWMAMQKKKDLDGSCRDNLCPADQRDRLDSAKLSGTISTIGIGVGAAAITLGTVLFFAAGPDSASAFNPARGRKKSSHHPVAPQGLRASAELGIGQVGVSGQF
jgi:hypothetical protein